MPNEFIIKNGFQSKGDSIVEGTLSSTTLNVSSTAIISNNVSGLTFYSTQSSGDEGGQIDLSIPQTNSNLSGSSVSIDIYQDRFRIFESGSPNRGVYIDLTTATPGVGSNLLSSTATFDYGKSYVIANNLQWF